MPFLLSERTSNSKALSTISRFVLSLVSLRALRTNPSSISMFVLPIGKLYTTFCELCVCLNSEWRESHVLVAREVPRLVRPSGLARDADPCRVGPCMLAREWDINSRRQREEKRERFT